MTVALSASLSARRISDFAHPAADVKSAGVSLLPVRCRATSVANLADALCAGGKCCVSIVHSQQQTIQKLWCVSHDSTAKEAA